MISSLLCAFLMISSGASFQAQATSSQPPLLPKLATIADLSFSTTTHVPGKDLKADHYTLAVLAAFPDRVVLMITSNGGKVETEFLAVPSTHKQVGEGFGPVMMKGSAKGLSALQGFRFPDGKAVDFVYPKDEAVKLATANASPVLAVDPVSEGKPPVPKMSAEAKQLVTLWQLSPVQVGPENTAGIDAKKYEPSPDAVAASTSKGSEAASPASSASANVEAASNVTPPRPVAPHHVVTELPHTASQQSLFSFLGLLCLGLAGALALRRLNT